MAVLAAARVVADGEHAPIGLRLAQAWPVAGLRDADAGSPPPWPTREVFAPRADAVVRPGSTGPVDGHGVSSRPPLKKTKRMDRRLRATGRLQTTNVKAQRCFPRLSPAHAMFEFKQCALSRTPRPPHPHCGHTHVPPFPPQSPHPSHVQHRPLFRCGDSTVLSAVPLPRPAAHPLAAAHASAVAPAASLDPLRPRAPNGQRMARHRCSTARRGSQHYDRCRGGNNQPPYRATSQDVQKTLNTNYNYLKDLFYAHLPPQVRDFWALLAIFGLALLAIFGLAIHQKDPRGALH